MKSIPLIITLAAIVALPAQAQKASDTPWSSMMPTRPSVAPPASTDSTLSFYKRKAEWNRIIDAYWGAGASVWDKQDIFTEYVNHLQHYFPAFEGLGISWDSLRAHYYAQITDSTSHGRFSAILSYLAYRLREPHVVVFDSLLTMTGTGDTAKLTYPSWGTPVWAQGMPTATHFGAILTPLPDSSAVVLHAIEDHPLGLEPGDVVLGYEGVPWRQLARELIASEVPTRILTGGSRAWETHQLLWSAGFNWHLFDTVDIVKYPAGDILHLPVDTLASIRMTDSMYLKQCLKVPGVPWPDFNTDKWANTQGVSHGIVDGTNIGYIYVTKHTYPDAQNRFDQAITELWNTDGLIIDLRFDTGGDTRTNFNETFARMMSFDTHTMDFWWRASRSDLFSLTPCPLEPGESMYINADEESLYDRPIAVLLGPNCVSMGDATAYRLTFLPNTRFFGKPTAMGFGGFRESIQKLNIPGYVLMGSEVVMRDHYSPQRDIERIEFPVDEVVWFTREDVANGDDTVVKKGLAWITGVAHAHDVMAASRFVAPADTLRLTASVENLNNHPVSVKAYFVVDSLVVDSSAFADDGLHGDGAAGDGVWGSDWVPPSVQIYSATISTADPVDSTQYTMPYSLRFTSIGPLEAVWPDTLEKILHYWGSTQMYWFNVRNKSSESVARDIAIKLTCDDPCVLLPQTVAPLGDVSPQDTSLLPVPIRFEFSGSCSGPKTVELTAHITMKGYEYWSETVTLMVTPVETEVASLPKEFALHQNYPNPFNPNTTIEYALPKASFVTLKVYNVMGQEVATLASGEHAPGIFNATWDASNVPTGVYFYRLTAGDYVQTRKAILAK
jgi:hypothetical protein